MNRIALALLALVLAALPSRAERIYCNHCALARRAAAGFDVAGYVRNLPDGRGGLVASGDDEDVDGFLAAVRESELAGHIDGEVAADVVKPAGLRGFEIRF